MNIALVAGVVDVITYRQWLSAADENIEFVEVTGAQSPDAMISLLGSCAGAVFTHGRSKDAAAMAVDQRTTLMQHALRHSMPVMAIAEGAEVLNTVQGGASTASEQHEGATIAITPGSVLSKITRETEGVVEGAERPEELILGKDLAAGALYVNGGISAIEWADNAGKGFALGTFWRPDENWRTQQFSAALARHFLFEAHSFELLRS